MPMSGVKITIRSGTHTGTEYWLTKRLTRVGSAAGCDILLQDAQTPAHAVSIERADGQIVVHNRMERSLVVNGNDVAPGGSQPWPHATTLRLTPRLELALDCHAEESSNSVHSLEDDEAIESTSHVAPVAGVVTGQAKPSSSNLFPLFFIAGCMGLIAFLIYFKASGKAESTPKSSLTWKKVWESHAAPQHENAQDKSQWTEAFRPRLQLLYRFQGLGDAPQFEKTQGELLRSIDREVERVPKAASNDQSEDPKKNLEALRDFVKSQKVGAR